VTRPAYEKWALEILTRADYDDYWYSARVRGWTITLSHFLNNQLDTVWLAEP